MNDDMPVDAMDQLRFLYKITTGEIGTDVRSMHLTTSLAWLFMNDLIYGELEYSQIDDHLVIVNYSLTDNGEKLAQLMIL